MQSNIKLIHYQETPLHIASRKGDARIVQLLLNNGSQIGAINDRDMTCLDIAIENDHKDVAMLIVNQKG